MTTSKRERQKANRAARIASAEAAARVQRTRSRIITYGSIAALTILVIVALNVFTGSSNDNSTAAPVTTTIAPTDSSSASVTTTTAAPAVEFVYGSGDCPAEDGSSPRTIDFSEPQPLCIDPTASYTAGIDASEGAARLPLAPSSAHGAGNHCVTPARCGDYNNTPVVLTDPSIAIIQSGSPHTEAASDPGPGYQIIYEPTFTTDSSTGQLVGPYSYSPGQLVMARSLGPNSSSAQFFFTTGPNAAALDGQGTYIVLGNTDDTGLGVLQQVIGLHEPDPTSGLGGAPSHTVTINSVTIEQS